MVTSVTFSDEVIKISSFDSKKCPPLHTFFSSISSFSLPCISRCSWLPVQCNFCNFRINRCGCSFKLLVSLYECYPQVKGILHPPNDLLWITPRVSKSLLLSHDWTENQKTVLLNWHTVNSLQQVWLFSVFFMNSRHSVSNLYRNGHFEGEVFF